MWVGLSYLTSRATLRLFFWMNTHEVQKFIVIARIHNNSSISTIPDYQLIILFKQIPCYWIFQGYLSGNKATKCSFARTEQLWGLASQSFSRLGLSIFSVNQNKRLREGHT
jgi:4-amino-4-deoxy-L-arabinose transferase-like glycosyltransferase